MSERWPEEVLWDRLRGALTTRALAIVADLGVPDALASGPRHVEELARELDADDGTLHRLMRALASDGVFAEEGRGVFRNTPVSELLCQDGWSKLAHFFGGVWHGAAGALEPDGLPPFERLYGADFWTWLAERPAERAAFDRAMVEGAERRTERLMSLTWQGDETVVDVGGGNGSTLLELLRRNPGLSGIVFDLPETVRDEDAFGDRCVFVAGDFFESVPSGDVYLLSTVLHDWDDKHASAILRTVRAGAHSDARLVVVDSVVPSGNEPHGAKWLDLLMLSLFGGRERDEEQWRALLGGAGFEPVRIEDKLIEARCR